MKNYILAQHPHLSQGVGCICQNYHLKVKSNYNTPLVDPPRNVPRATKMQVKAELKRMEDIGVIVHQHQWVNSFTIVRKADKIGLCLDPTNLNQALMHAHHPYRTIEDITSRMPEAKVFSTLDAECGYWQIELDTASSL